MDHSEYNVYALACTTRCTQLYIPTHAHHNQHAPVQALTCRQWLSDPHLQSRLSGWPEQPQLCTGSLTLCLATMPQPLPADHRRTTPTMPPSPPTPTSVQRLPRLLPAQQPPSLLAVLLIYSALTVSGPNQPTPPLVYSGSLTRCLATKPGQ